MKKNSDASGIVLLSKRPGLTSFSSLYAVKKALGTTKVGHTGTLDSFAQGLLVVCVGNLTRLASHITSFNKSYQAVIEFGKETDTLEPTGNVIKTAALPTLENLIKSLEKFSGAQKQFPPEFSALKIDGSRASDLIRQGKKVELEARDITIFSNALLEVKFEDDSNYDFLKNGLSFSAFNDGIAETVVTEPISVGTEALEVPHFLSKKVKYARIQFDVSKGTYIRSLARDIALDCNSAGHLVGLLRTKIGCFNLEDSAGFSLLKNFTIDLVLKDLESLTIDEEFKNKKIPDEEFQFLIEEIKLKTRDMIKEVALLSGLKIAVIKSDAEFDFSNGRPLRTKMFVELNQNPQLENFQIETNFKNENFENLQNEKNSQNENFQKNQTELEQKFAVFSESQKFLGVILVKENRIFYEYVIPQNKK